jgi:hypothetical protein
MLPHDRNGLRRRDVVPWTPVVLPIGSFEMFRDDLFPPRKPVATAHEGDYGRSEITLAFSTLKHPCLSLEVQVTNLELLGAVY